MANFSILQKNYESLFSNAHISHLAKGWSGSEIGSRHPTMPVGYTIRDQGQLDLFSGKSRIILSIEGYRVDFSTYYKNISYQTHFSTNGISNFKILGKNFVKEIHDGQKAVAIKNSQSIGPYSVIGPSTKVIVAGQIGEIIGEVPMSSIFDERQIFESESNELLPKIVEEHNIIIDSVILAKNL